VSFRDILSRLFGVSDQRPEPQRWIGDPDPDYRFTSGPMSEFDNGITDDTAEDRADERRILAAVRANPTVLNLVEARVELEKTGVANPAIAAELDEVEKALADAPRELPTVDARAAEADSRVAFPADSFEDYYIPAGYSTPGYTAPAYTPGNREAAGDERDASQEEQEAAPIEAGDVDAPKGWYEHGAITYQQLATQARFVGRDDQAEIYDAYAEQFAKLHDEAEVDAAIETAAAEAPTDAGDDRDRELRLTLLLTDAAVANAAAAAQQAADEATREDIPDGSHSSRDSSRASRDASRDDACAGY
jgi:hypothetical protein